MMAKHKSPHYDWCIRVMVNIMIRLMTWEVVACKVTMIIDPCWITSNCQSIATGTISDGQCCLTMEIKIYRCNQPKMLETTNIHQILIANDHCHRQCSTRVPCAARAPFRAALYQSGRPSQLLTSAALTREIVGELIFCGKTRSGTSTIYSILQLVYL